MPLIPSSPPPPAPTLQILFNQFSIPELLGPQRRTSEGNKTINQLIKYFKVALTTAKTTDKTVKTEWWDAGMVMWVKVQICIWPS